MYPVHVSINTRGDCQFDEHITAHIARLIQHADVVAEEKRGTEDDDEYREDDVRRQTLKPTVTGIQPRLRVLLMVVIPKLHQCSS